MKRGRLTAAAALAGLLALLGGWLFFQRWLATPLAIGPPSVRIEIARGEPLTHTARELERRGHLEHPKLLAVYARLTGADSRIKAGEYDIPSGTTPRSLLALFESGAVVRHALTIVEGWTFHDLRRAIERDHVLRKTLAGSDDATILKRLGEHRESPEGLFFPDTYVFSKGTTDLELLGQARGRMRLELERAWNDRAPGLPFETAYEALILASIVEKETALPAERPRIAGVFVERLRRGMRLQTDPTVIYGLGPGFDGNLRRSDLERDGPYNTYTRAGLPPTPIAMPGAAALAAAVRPDERGEIYFVATGLPDGSHAFSKSLAEHERAVAEYLKRYRQQNSGH